MHMHVRVHVYVRVHVHISVATLAQGARPALACCHPHDLLDWSSSRVACRISVSRCLCARSVTTHRLARRAGIKFKWLPFLPHKLRLCSLTPPAATEQAPLKRGLFGRVVVRRTAPPRPAFAAIAVVVCNVFVPGSASGVGSRSEPYHV